jgi:Leucine-rich repeat (LRR) protein
MEVLGLLPPYSIEDVHKAYKARAREAHPDQGGSPAEFMKLRQAYEQAQEYMSFRAGRREWMSYLVEPYIKQQELVEEVRRRGGDVRMESIDWMKKSYGDFASLTERLGRITLRNAADADEFLSSLHNYRDQLKHLTELDLSGSTITAAGTAAIAEIKSLKRVNLSGTPVTAAMLKPLAALPDLAWLGLAGCPLGIAGPLRVRLRLPRVKIGWE